MTQKGHAIRERSVAVIQEALRRVGLTVDVVPMEAGMMARWGKGDYEAIYMGLNFDSFDPGRNSGILEQQRLVSSLASRSAEAGDGVGGAHRRPHPPAVAHAR